MTKNSSYCQSVNFSSGSHEDLMALPAPSSLPDALQGGYKHFDAPGTGFSPPGLTLLLILSNFLKFPKSCPF